MERQGLVTFQGQPLTLTGTGVHVGDAAPNFTVLNTDLKPVSLEHFMGQGVIISSVPSLDTPVCALQTKRFNQEAPALGAVILTISMDLPFAQKRFCEAYQIDGVHLLSDYRDRDFGQKYGLLIKELGLLARAVLILDPAGKISYMEIVNEIAREPDYQAALAMVRKIKG